MKRKSWLWLLILASIVLVIKREPQIIPRVETEVRQATIRVQPYVYSLGDSINRKINGTTKTANDKQVGKVATPVESPLKNVTTSNTYYFHFKKDVPQSVRDVFTNAVNAYNDTGIVRLIPGTAQPNQNGITFFVYHKKIQNIASNTVELGNGGPSALTINHYAINSAQAGLNITYPNLSVKNSVALHELGHALGLAHSSYTNSIMYPVDQGVTTLSTADLNGLRNIYK